MTMEHQSDENSDLEPKKTNGHSSNAAITQSVPFKVDNVSTFFTPPPTPPPTLTIIEHTYLPTKAEDVKNAHQRLQQIWKQLQPSIIVKAEDQQINFSYVDSVFMERLDLLTEHTTKILTFADRFNCVQVNANGFHSIGKLVFRFYVVLENNLAQLALQGQLKQMQTVLVQAVDSFLQLTKYMLQQHECALKGVQEAQSDNIDQSESKGDKEENLLNNNSSDDQKLVKRIVSNGQTNLDGQELNNNEITTKERKSSFVFGRIFRSISVPGECVPGQNDSLSSLPLFTSGLEHFEEMIRTAITHHAPRVSLLSHFGVFWLDRSMNNFFNLYSFLIPFAQLNLIESVKCIWSRDFRLNKYIELVRHPTFEMPFNVWDMTENFFYRKMFISLLYFRVKVKSHTLTVPRQKIYFISPEGLVDHPLPRTQSKRHNRIEVRCRLTLPTINTSSNHNKRPFDQLILHFHGGGFVSHSADSHESYIRDWSSKGHTPVLSVDYSLRKPFPVALQEAFDVYYWLRTASKEKVTEKLGFYPKQIVLVGDSAGGNLSLSLAVFLHHILTEHPQRVHSSLRLPDGIVGIYGAYLLVPLISGSRILSSIDTLINPEILMFLMAVYSGVLKEPKRRSWLSSLNLFSSGNSVPALWNDQGTLNFDMEKVIQITSSPFISPMLYEHMDKLKIPLSLVTTEFCPFLDESITIAKSWKGPLEIDVLENLNHGFLNFNIFCRRAQEGVDLCTNRIRQMLNSLRNNL